MLKSDLITGKTYFQLFFSAQVWSFFYPLALFVSLSVFENGIRWIKNPARDVSIGYIYIYIWKERLKVTLCS